MTRMLTGREPRALALLAKFPDGFCPGDAAQGEFGTELIALLNALVRKKRARAEPTDDGPRFFVTALGRSEAQALDREGQ